MTNLPTEPAVPADHMTIPLNTFAVKEVCKLLPSSDDFPALLNVAISAPPEFVLGLNLAEMIPPQIDWDKSSITNNSERNSVQYSLHVTFEIPRLG